MLVNYTLQFHLEREKWHGEEAEVLPPCHGGPNQNWASMPLLKSFL